MGQFFPERLLDWFFLNKNRERYGGNLNGGILAVNFHALTFQSRLYIIVCHFVVGQHDCKEK